MKNLESHPLHPKGNVPFFISAGVLKDPVQLEPFYNIKDPAMAPVLTHGAFTLKDWPGNAKAGEQDFVYYESLGTAGNAIGLRNGGIEAIRRLKEPIKKLSEIGIKSIVQVTNLPHESPLEVIRPLIYEAAAVKPLAIEVNLSCPNGLKHDGTFHPPTCNNPDQSAEVMSAARQEAGPEIILLAKDSAHIDSLDDEIREEEIRQLAYYLEAYINGVVGINTIGNQPFPELICANGRGGMSGPVIAPIANEHQRIWHEAKPDLAYLSCGGIDTANAAAEIPKRLAAGAILVGGAQEFYRANNVMDIVTAWALKWAASMSTEK